MVMDPNRLDTYLDGVDFPVDKKTLISSTQERAAPFEVTYAMEQLPEKKYGSLDEVKAEVGKLS